MSLRPRAAPATQAKGGSRLAFVLRVGQRPVDVADTGPSAAEASNVPRKGGPHSDFDKFTDTNEAKAWAKKKQELGEKNAQSTLARIREKKEARAAKVQRLRDEAKARLAEADRIEGLAGYQTDRVGPPPKPEEPIIAKQEADAQAMLAKQQELSEAAMKVMHELKTAATQNAEDLRDIDRVIQDAELGRKVLFDQLRSLGEDKEDVRTAIEEQIVSLNGLIERSQTAFKEFLRENNTEIVSDLRMMLEERLTELLTSQCGDKIDFQTEMIAQLQDDLANLRAADQRAVAAIEERVAKRREDEAEEMRKVLSLINPDKFAEQLFYAIQANNKEKCELLIDYGADPYRKLNDDSRGLTAFESAFYGNLPDTKGYFLSAYKSKQKLAESMVDERIEILKLLRDPEGNLCTMHKQYELALANDIYQPNVDFLANSNVRAQNTFPSRLLVGALEAGVLSNEPLLYQNVTFYVGGSTRLDTSTRLGTTPLYLFGTSFLEVRANSKKPLEKLQSDDRYAQEQNYKYARQYNFAQELNRNAETYFKELLQGGFRDDGLRSLLQFIANRADTIPWVANKNPYYPQKEWDWKKSRAQEGARVERGYPHDMSSIMVVKERSVEAAQEILDIWEEAMRGRQ